MSAVLLKLALKRDDRAPIALPPRPIEYPHLDAADLAKIIRKDLRRHFPSIVFQVRTEKYSMGSTVSVHWTDGPTTARVDATLARYDTHDVSGHDDSDRNTGPVTLDDGRTVRIYSWVRTSRTVSEALHARVAAWFDRNREGLDRMDREQEIHRASWRAEVVNDCLIVKKG